MSIFSTFRNSYLLQTFIFDDQIVFDHKEHITL